MRFVHFTAALLIQLMAASPSIAQSDISGEIVNPYGFIPQGGSEVIQIRLVNPEDSGKIVTDISSWGSSGLLSNDVPFGEARFYSQKPEQCEQILHCFIEGDLPLSPGESLIVGFTEIVLPESIDVSAQFSINSIRLNLEVDASPYILTFTNQVLKYVAPAEIEDHSSSYDGFFACDDTGLRIRPDPDSPALAASIIVPETVEAGSAFAIHALLQNHGNSQASFYRPFTSLELTGSHADSYSFKQCDYLYCGATNVSSLRPGQGIEIELGTLYYTRDTLYQGELQINALHVLIGGSSKPLNLGSCSFTVDVTSPSQQLEPNEKFENADKQALYFKDFQTNGDELIVHDPNTGFDWLRLNETLGLSVAEVDNRLLHGGKYEGFRLASISEIKALALNYLQSKSFAFNAELFATFDNRSNVALYDFVRMLGQHADGGPGLSRTVTGFVRNLPAWNVRRERTLATVTSLNRSIFSNVNNGNIYLWNRRDIDNGSEYYGFWLVNTHSAYQAIRNNLPEFYAGELRLPAVRVDDRNYLVTMNFNNEATGTLQYTAISDSSFEIPTATFDSASGILDIPVLAMRDIHNNTHYHRVQLEYLPYPYSNLFRIIETEFLNSELAISDTAVAPLAQ